MPQKNNQNSVHAQRMKEIRPYVGFDYDLRTELTPYAKSKIKKYYEEIQQLTARPNQVYRPRRKDRLKAAQEFGQHEKHLRDLNVAFIPTNGNEKRKIKFDKSGNITAVSEFVKTRVLPVDREKLVSAENARDYINDLIKTVPDAKSFTVLAGAFEIPQGHSRRSLPRFVAQLVTKYSNVNDLGEKANNHHNNWLHGIAAHSFKQQEDFQDYLSEKQNNKQKMQRKRRNAKRRANRK